MVRRQVLPTRSTGRLQGPTRCSGHFWHNDTPWPRASYLECFTSCPRLGGTSAVLYQIPITSKLILSGPRGVRHDDGPALADAKAIGVASSTLQPTSPRCASNSLPQHPRHGRPRRLRRGHLLRNGRAWQGPVRERRVQAQDDLGGRHSRGVLLLRGQLARVPRKMRQSCADLVFLRVLMTASFDSSEYTTQSGSRTEIPTEGQSKA
jgi:hypothetical protein